VSLLTLTTARTLYRIENACAATFIDSCVAACRRRKNRTVPTNVTQHADYRSVLELCLSSCTRATRPANPITRKGLWVESIGCRDAVRLHRFVMLSGKRTTRNLFVIHINISFTRSLLGYWQYYRTCGNNIDEAKY